MTYLEFLLYFLISPLIVMGYFYHRKQDEEKNFFSRGMLALVVLALFYTTPWDNYLVKTKVWWYGIDRVLGTIGYVPIEEYCFFVLQTLLTSLLCYFLHKKIPLVITPQREHWRWPIAFVLIGVILLGVNCLYYQQAHYLGLILSWAFPILLIQWLAGAGLLLSNLRLFFLTVMIPTVYLWIADALAISWKIWTISDSQTLGIKIGPLPMEEALFFLVTNVMVGQGLILFVILGKKFFEGKRMGEIAQAFPGEA